MITASKNRGNSYYEILMEHVRLSEKVQDAPDAIDPMLYHYGLALYKDVPLIESPEETEQFRMDTVCVAVDTSGSCSGEVASRFLRETCNIFRDIKSRGLQADFISMVLQTKNEELLKVCVEKNLIPSEQLGIVADAAVEFGYINLIPMITYLQICGEEGGTVCIQ